MARGARANNKLDRIVLLVAVGVSLVLLALPMPAREPIANILRRTFLAPAILLQEQAELSRRAFLNHEEMIRVRDSVSLQALSAPVLATENERLRQLLGLGSRLKWGFIPAQALRGRGVRDDASMILGEGSQAGVERLAPVIAPEGLVGIVDNVDPTMSQVLLWTHPDFRVSAVSEDGSAFGIVQAHVGDGPGRYLLEMRGVPFRTALKPGAVIVSSGLGGIYPRGIPIGTVLGETQTAETWARTYLIRPAVFPADVYAVMILRPERAQEGLGSVWATGHAADSAVRAIVTAGDSMARAAALAESQARQAAQDSARRDSLARLGIRDTTVPLQPVSPPPAPALPRDSVRRPPGRDTANLPNTI